MAIHDPQNSNEEDNGDVVQDKELDQVQPCQMEEEDPTHVEVECQIVDETQEQAEYQTHEDLAKCQIQDNVDDDVQEQDQDQDQGQDQDKITESDQVAEEEEEVADGEQPTRKGKREEEAPGGGGENKWPNWPGYSVFRMLVAEKQVGSILGPKGQRIQKIVKETNARIKIIHGPPGTGEAVVMVSAKEEPDAALPPAIDGLLRVHKQIADSSYVPPGVKFLTRLLVPVSQGLSLIGKEGANVKPIVEESKCNVTLLVDVPSFGLEGDRVVDIVGDATGAHRAVELIASHLRKFLVDGSIIPLFEKRLKGPNHQMNHMPPPQQSWGPRQRPSQNAGGGGYGHNPQAQYMPPQQSWGPGQRPSQNAGGGGYGHNPQPQYMPPERHVNNYYPPPEMHPPMDKQPHQGISSYGREPPMRAHAPSSTQGAPSISRQVTQQLQIPLSFADAVIGTSGSNISYIRRASGAKVTIQETKGVPGEMTVEISGSASHVQTAQQLIQNSVAQRSP